MKQRPCFAAGIVLTILIITSGGAAYGDPARIGSITDHVKNPVRVALDSQGNVYVSETARNVVNIYTGKGQYLKSIRLSHPLGIAVDPAGKIYIGSESKKSVEVYNTDLTYSHTLGAGPDETAKPNSIAIDSTGRIYVVDSIREIVKVYEPAGTFAFSFGGTGNTDGLFNMPTAIAANDAAGELYVTDLALVQTESGSGNGARIQVFDKNGTFKRSFGQFGANVGQIATPMDIAKDRTGNLYVADSYQGAVHILDPANGASKGALYDTAHPLLTPLGVAIGKDNNVYVASYSGHSVEIYALDGHTTLEITPASLAFSAKQYNPNPPDQTAVITNSGSGALHWTAAADKSWIILKSNDQTGASAAGTIDPSSSNNFNVGVNISSLVPGDYVGRVVITAGTAATQTIGVNLTVLPPPMLSLSNGWLAFSAQRGKNPAPQLVTISIINDTHASWSSTASDPSWLSITPSSGSSTTAAIVAVTSSTLSAGAYTGAITFSSPGTLGDGSKLTVTLTVGSPSPTTPSDKDLSKAKTIITAPGPGPKNQAMIKTYKADGSPAGIEFIASDELYGANVAAGDIDGDGAAEIIIGAGPGPENHAAVHIYRADKTKVAEFLPFNTKYGVQVAAADLDGDGAAEIIVSPGPGRKNSGIVKIYAYDKERNQVISTGLRITVPNSDYGVNIAAADTEGDRMPEIITAPGGYGRTKSARIRIWKVDTTMGMGNWTAAVAHEIPLSGAYGATLAAGDMDADGRDELIIGAGPGPGTEAEITIIKIPEGTEVARFTAFDDYTYGVTVAAADMDGDGRAEVIAGAGPDPRAGVKAAEESANEDTKGEKGNVWAHRKKKQQAVADPSEPTVKVYSAAGEIKYSMTPYQDAGYGVKVAVGDLGI